MTNENYNSQINAGTRIATMFLDHVFMTFIAMVFFMPSFFVGFMDDFNSSPEQARADIMNGPWDYIGMFGFSLYFCKDIINGRSFAKRILKLQLVDNKTGQVAGPIQCLVRNLFCILWPVEGIIAMVNTSRRLGDRIASTRLVKYDPTLEQPKPQFFKIIFAIVLAYGFILLIIQATMTQI